MKGLQTLILSQTHFIRMSDNQCLKRCLMEKNSTLFCNETNTKRARLLRTRLKRAHMKPSVFRSRDAHVGLVFLVSSDQDHVALAFSITSSVGCESVRVLKVI